MTEKPTFEVFWTLTGTALIEADSIEEAQEKFNRLSPADLAENGELTNADPVLRVEE